MDNKYITIPADVFLRIFVKNSTINCVSKDVQVEKDLNKLNSNQVTLCFISNYIKKKINDLMIVQLKYINVKQYYSDLENNLYKQNIASKEGRLGPENVLFDLNTLIGQIKIDRSTNTLMSNSGFATIKANCFLFSGKWQYEVLLTTKGVMQLGWASTMCNFTTEKGVGDTLNSYSYDGNRIKKWNVVSSEYGEQWQLNDVIGVCIDLNEYTISFYRNGKFLGNAFTDITIGAGIVYFPAVSLAYNERIIVNFGARMFKYPIDDYKPLEQQNNFEVSKANMLIEWLFNLVLMETNEESNISSNSNDNSFIKNSAKKLGKKNSKNNPFFYLASSLILEELETLLTNEYIVEACLLKNLILFHNKEEIHCFLDILWSLMNEYNLDLFFNIITLIIVHGYQFSQFNNEEVLLSELNYSTSSLATLACSNYKISKEINFITQKQYLYLFLLLIQHSKTRLYLLNNVLFKKNLLFHLLDSKLILDNDILKKHLFPNLSLNDLNHQFNIQNDNINADSANNFSNSDYNTQTFFENKFWKNQDFENSVSELESLQNMILDTLIFQDENCRAIFLDKFSVFLLEVERSFINITNRSINNTSAIPFSVLLSVFHRLCFLIRNQYENVINCFSLEFFLDEKLCPKSKIRIGGLYNHLQKNHEKEISNYNIKMSNTNPLLVQVFILIDSLIKLYSIGVHKQLNKYNSVKESLIEYNQSLKNLNSLLKDNEKFDDFKTFNYSENHLQFTKNILETEYLNKGNQFSILHNIIFSFNRKQDIIWLFKIILKTFEDASNSGCFLSYLPDYYLVTCINLSIALRFYFGNEIYPGSENIGLDHTLSLKKTEKNEYKKVLKMFSLFITNHFCDDRIINHDHKELIAQSLTSLIASKKSLSILENIPIENRLNLIKKLTLPFENRAWAHSNWILLRFWKGSGFAFKKNSAKLMSDVFINENNYNLNLFTKNDLNSNLNSIKPLPSLVFQQLLCDYLNSNQSKAFSFLTSLLNQLNWSFSEFVGIFQDIQNTTVRQESFNLDFRQLKICCTCHDLSKGLLRVLEMILHYDATLILKETNEYKNFDECVSNNRSIKNDMKYSLSFNQDSFENTKNLNNYFGIVDDLEEINEENYLDDLNDIIYSKDIQKEKIKNTETNEVLLQQLCSILNQIFNRITMSTQCFKYIRQSTSSVLLNEFFILSSAIGVLIELIVKNEQTRYLTLNLLVNDLNFQIDSFLLLTKDSQIYQKPKKNSSQIKNDLIDKKSYLEKKFKFDRFVNNLNEDEQKSLDQLLKYIISSNERFEKLKLIDDCQEEELCTICYANKKAVLFIPCKHQSCRSCITIHFLRKSECFFCKIQLEKVKILKTNQIIYPQKIN